MKLDEVPTYIDIYNIRTKKKSCKNERFWHKKWLENFFYIRDTNICKKVCIGRSSFVRTNSFGSVLEKQVVYHILSVKQIII